MFLISSQTLIQKITPSSVLGYIAGMRYSINDGMTVAAMSITGILTERFGSSSIIFYISVIFIVTVILFNIKVF